MGQKPVLRPLRTRIQRMMISALMPMAEAPSSHQMTWKRAAREPPIMAAALLQTSFR